ncbi:MAG TPA: DegV family protein [Acidimicrobiales bacterium]|nr:DegV family protein [Acidimicrobiales bacterium]
MIGLCTDSNAQLPPSLVERYRIEVVPLTVVVDAVEHLEGEDLDADGFFSMFERAGAGSPPTVTTAAPSPGRFAEAYGRLAAAGATEILSVHLGSAISATCNSARLAAGGAPVPVRLVDTGTASFAVGCAVWEAGEVASRGGDLEEAAHAATRVASACGNVFVVGALDLARAGGRLAADAADPLTVLALEDGAMRPVASFAAASDAAQAMADRIAAEGAGRRLRVGVGHSDETSASIAASLASLLADDPAGHELVRYRVGPSVAAHTGPGTAGAVFHPLEP